MHTLMKVCRIAIFPLFFLLFGGPVFALDADTLNQTDRNNQRQGYWIVRNSEKQNPDCDESAKLEEGRYEAGLKTGVWKFYSCSGGLKSEITFKEDKKIGYAKMFGANGKLREEGYWNINHWEGKYNFYHENGVLYQDFNFGTDGKRDGVQKYYHENGKLMYDGTWKDSKESGVFRSYNEDGQLVEESIFNDGKLEPSSVKTIEPKKAEPEPEPVKTEESKPQKPVVPGQIPDGFHKTFNETGQLMREGEFKNGFLVEGKQFFYEGTKLVKTQIIINGSVSKTLYEKK